MFPINKLCARDGFKFEHFELIKFTTWANVIFKLTI